MTMRVLKPDETAVGPQTRLLYWYELLPGEPSYGYKTYRRGASHLRLVLSIPRWVGRALCWLGAR